MGKPQVDSKAVASTAQAIEAIKINAQTELRWRSIATILLDMVGQPGVDQEVLVGKCREHSEIGKSL